MRVYKKEQNHAATYSPSPRHCLIWIRIVRYNKKIAFSTRCAKRAKAQKRAREKKKKAEKAENKNEKLLCTARRRQIARQVFGGGAWQAVKGGSEGERSFAYSK